MRTDDHCQNQMPPGLPDEDLQGNDWSRDGFCAIDSFQVMLLISSLAMLGLSIRIILSSALP